MIDLSSESACHEAVASAVARFGRLDAVINNAGIGPSSLRPDAEQNLPRIEELTTEIWDNFFAINVRAPMLLVQAALPHMKGVRAHHQQHDKLPHHAARAPLRGDEVRARIHVGDLGGGTEGARHHGERADPGRADRHTVHLGWRRLGPGENAAGPRSWGRRPAG